MLYCFLILMIITQNHYTTGNIEEDHPTHILLYPFKVNTSVFVITFPLWCSQNYTKPLYELSTNVTKYYIYGKNFTLFYKSVVPVNDSKKVNKTQCVHKHIFHINGSWDHLMKNVSQANATESYVYIPPSENYVFNTSYYTFFVYTKNITALTNGLHLHLYSIPSKSHYNIKSKVKNPHQLSASMPLKKPCVCSDIEPSICRSHECYNSYAHDCPICHKLKKDCSHTKYHCLDVCTKRGYEQCSWCTSQKPCQCRCPSMARTCDCKNPLVRSPIVWNIPAVRPVYIDTRALTQQCGPGNKGPNCNRALVRQQSAVNVHRGPSFNPAVSGHSYFLRLDHLDHSNLHTPGGKGLGSGSYGKKRRKRSSTIQRHDQSRILVKDFWFDHISNVSSKDLQNASKVFHNISSQQLELKSPAFFRYNASRTTHQGTYCNVLEHNFLRFSQQLSSIWCIVTTLPYWMLQTIIY
ncbi:glycoprotein ORF-R [Elephant endotheliotropic herpesvirus 3B]|nr:glycoprotein ORF-R [Elephant endotheliotropic herpesvirus 3B]